MGLLELRSERFRPTCATETRTLRPRSRSRRPDREESGEGREEISSRERSSREVPEREVEDNPSSGTDPTASTSRDGAPPATVDARGPSSSDGPGATRRLIENPPPDMLLREALSRGEILCLGGETAEGHHLPGSVTDGRVRVAPPAIAARITQVMTRMMPSGMMRMVAGLQAYLSVLGMELVIAVNDVVQRAQNGERGFAPGDTVVLMPRGRPGGHEEDPPEKKRPRSTKGLSRRRRMMRRRRSCGLLLRSGERRQLPERLPDGAKQWLPPFRQS